MKGFYLMDRGWMDDPVFQREPFCRRSAWAWLVENACITEQRVRCPEGEIVLARGQLTYSIRYLAKAWGWSEPKVRRYLDAIRKAKKIDAATDAGQTVITICDYEKLQSPSKAADAATDARATQDRRTTDANKNKAKEGNEGKATASTVENGHLTRIARNLCNAAGIEMPDPGRHWGKHKEVLDLVTSWVDAGMAGDDLEKLIITRTSAAPDRAKSLRYFDGAVRDLLKTRGAGETQRIEADIVIKPLREVDENALRDALSQTMGNDAWRVWSPKLSFQCRYDASGRTLLVGCDGQLNILTTKWAERLRPVFEQFDFDGVEERCVASSSAPISNVVPINRDDQPTSNRNSHETSHSTEAL